MSEEISIVGIEVEHRQSDITGMIENDQGFDTGDQHVATDVELLPVNQQRIHDVSNTETIVKREGEKDRQTSE